MDVLEELKKSIEPAVGITRSKIFSPYQTFLKVCRLFNKDIKEFAIQITVDNLIKGYQIKDFEYALWIAMLNIINNAVYWLKLSDDQRYIRLKLEKQNKLVIMNNGPEIVADYLDLIFEYGITLKKEKNATGLGLSFTRSILSKHDWEISAENRDEGPAFIIYKSKGGD
ncbi:MAG: sensor histidine kinase [Candidatus Heimdallarchaeota archaeon]